MSESPLTNYHFIVEWGADSRIGFLEASGLHPRHEVIEYREGINKTYTTTKVPGLRKYPNIVLRRGLCRGDNDFFEWWNSVNFNEDKRTITIKHLDDEHKPDITWILTEAWPVSVKFTELHALKSKILIERLELAYELLSMKND